MSVRAFCAALGSSIRPQRGFGPIGQGAMVEGTDDLHDATMRKYKEQYWSDAILLTSAIYQRLPKQTRRADILPIY